jgi:23S rRNA (cytidine1920-2'-O)/16S rRNA (cytidine1409-2'-O)-methyltransferase
VDGRILDKAAAKIAPGAKIEAEPAHPYVSRAALKLAAGLDAFAIDPAGLVCLDVGASTGGFTQLLLERGAALVAAVDVGRDQLHAALRDDARVLSLEACDARALTLARIGGRAPQLIVCDASFIALEKVLPIPLELAAKGAHLVALFKPQFQVGRAHVGKGGIVSDGDAVETARAMTRVFLSKAGFEVTGETESPITGGDGNREYLIGAKKA